MTHYLIHDVDFQQVRAYCGRMVEMGRFKKVLLCNHFDADCPHIHVLIEFNCPRNLLDYVFIDFKYVDECRGPESDFRFYLERAHLTKRRYKVITIQRL